MGGYVVALPSLQAGGAERVALNLAAGLRALGEDVDLLVLDGQGPLRAHVDRRLTLRDLGRRRARSAALPLLRHLRATAPTVVVASQTHLNLLLCLLRPLLPRRTRLVLRAPLLRDVGDRPTAPTVVDRAVRRLYPRAALLVASSDTMAAEFATLIPSSRRPAVAVLPNPVDIDGLRASATPAVRSPGPGRRIVTVSRLIPRKGVDGIIAAFASIAEPDDLLTVVGDGPEAPRLRELAAVHDVAAQVHFTGHLARPAGVMAGADTMIVAAEREGMPNAVLEALAVGTPVIAPDDLTPVVELAAQLPAGAVRLEPRRLMARALSEVSPRTWTGGEPRASLLPPAHRPEAVAALLQDALARIAA